MSDSAIHYELLVRARDGERLHELPSSGKVIIGRALDVDVRIDDASISRRHAALHLGSVVHIEDLGSANGVHLRRDVSDVKTLQNTPALKQRAGEWVALASGDEVLIGTVSVTFRQTSKSVGPNACNVTVVESPAMQALHARARKVAQGDVSVLLLGETGVGKEVLARVIHEASSRAKKPLLTLNCAALPESLLESELFGYEKGSFSGATQARPGLFESADGGTVFLDEIGELPLGAQARLLRVLEQREVMRIGARVAQRIDVRFISATNRHLETEVTKGKFRQDLLFRLNAVTLEIPPLRNRVEEIPRLAAVFLEAIYQKSGRRVPTISAATMATLVGYGFPGNVRELRNALEHAATECEGSVVLPEHLPARMLGGAKTESSSPGVREVNAALGQIERRRIEEALEVCQGNQTRAAEMLGISRRTLVGRLSEYGMPRPRKKG